MKIFPSNDFHMACFKGELEKFKAIIENDDSGWWLSFEKISIQEAVSEGHIPIIDYIIDNFMFELLDLESEGMTNSVSFNYRYFFYDMFCGEVKSSKAIKEHIINKALLSFKNLNDKSAGTLLVQSLELVQRTKDVLFFNKIINDTLKKFLSLSDTVKQEKKSAFITASVMKGNLIVLQDVIKQLKPTPSELSNALSCAVMNMDDSLISFLMAQGANIASSVEGHLVQIVVKENTILMNYIMENFGKEVSPISYLALRRACYIGNFDIVKILINSGTSIYSRDGSESCLRQAAYQGHLEILKFLCEKTGNDHSVEMYEALVMACGRNQLTTVKYLTEDQRLDLSNDTSLLESAIKTNAFDVVNYLRVNHGLVCNGLEEYLQINKRRELSKADSFHRKKNNDSLERTYLKLNNNRCKGDESNETQWVMLDVTYEEMENELNQYVKGLKFLRNHKDGDQFWKFKSPRWTWEKLCGREGYAIIRGGDTVSSIVTVMS